MGRRGTNARRAALVVATALALTGCSDEGEPEATPTGQASEEPSAESSPTEPPPPEPVDPCTLLTAEDLEAAGVPGELDEAVRSLVPDPRTTSCLVPHPQDGWGVYYGFSTTPGVKVKDAIDQVGTEKPVRLSVGDEAQLVLYDAYDDKTWHAWASEGRYAVMLQLFEKPKPADVEVLLARLLEQVDEDMFGFPVDLPDRCPPPQQRAITDLLGGKVVTATGSDRPDDLRCDYANARGLTVNLNGSPMSSPDKVRKSVGSLAKYYDDRVDVARGVTLLLSPGEGYAFSRAYVERPPSSLGTSLQSMTVIGDFYRPLEYDVEKYRALAVWWSKQRP